MSCSTKSGSRSSKYPSYCLDLRLSALIRGSFRWWQIDYAQTQIRRRVASDSVHAFQSARGRRRLAVVESHAVEERVQDCALGMGGQQGGMVNEAGYFPAVCKKSLQAMVADMQGAIGADFFSTYSLAQLQRFTPRELEACGRLTQPLLLARGEDYYRPISWDAALEKIAVKLRGTNPNETFWYVSGRSSNEAGFLLQLFARLYGTNNVNNCSYYCHQASGVGLTSVLGSGAGTVQLDDVENADLVFLIGGNPASNHPRLMSSLNKVRRRGGQIIVANPAKETGLVNFRVPSDVRSLLFGTEIASLYLQPHIGGDLALMCGLAKRIVEIGAQNEAFLALHCSGWPELKTALGELRWDEIVAKSGISRTEIDAAADRYAAAGRVVFAWTMGITHHTHGVENVQAIANLALVRGWSGSQARGCCRSAGIPMCKEWAQSASRPNFEKRFSRGSNRNST